MLERIPRCLLRTLEAAERLPMDGGPQSSVLITAIQEALVEVEDDVLVLDCGQCPSQYNARLVGGHAIYMCNNGEACAARAEINARADES